MRLSDSIFGVGLICVVAGACDGAGSDPVSQDVGGLPDASPDSAEVSAETSDVAVDSAIDTTTADTTPADTRPSEELPETQLYCEPNPCAEVPTAGCSRDRTAAVEVTASCAEGADGPLCSYAPGPLELCELGPCVLGACIDMTDRCDWPYTERISYVTEIRFQGEPACCHDFDGDGVVDNAFGTLMAQLAPAIGSFDDWMTANIDGHHMNLLFDIMGLDEPLTDPIDDPSIDVIGYESNFDNVVFVDPKTGLSSVKLKLLSFLDEIDWIPRNHAVGRIDQGHISVRDGRLGFVFFLNDQVVELLVEDMHFEGDLSLGPNGKGFAIDGDGGRGARLWGRVTRDSFLTAMNGEFQWNCCTAFAVEDGEAPLNLAENRCNTPVSSCEETPGLCTALADPDTCNLLFTLLAPDLDADGDGTKESMSLGFHFKATSGSIGWMESCGPAPTDPNFPGND